MKQMSRQNLSDRQVTSCEFLTVTVFPVKYLIFDILSVSVPAAGEKPGCCETSRFSSYLVK